MARKTSDVPKQNGNQNGNGQHQLDPTQLKADIESMMTAREAVASKNQSVGTLAKKFEDKGYNKKGFTLAVTMAKMSPENRNDLVRFLKFAIEAMGWDDPDLLDAMQADEPNNTRTRGRIAKDLNS